MHMSWLIARRRFRTFRARLPREFGSGVPYFATVLINSIGDGLFLPFSVLYFHLVVGLPLPLVGVGLSIATVVRLMVTPLGGPLVDRFGARPMAVVTNLLSAVGYAAYLSVHSFAAFLLAALFLAVGSSSRNTSEQALVVELVAPEGRDRWYALVRMALNVGVGGGALLAGILVTSKGAAGYYWMVGLTALSFTLAAGMLLLVRVQRATGVTNVKSGTYRTVLRNRPFLGLVGANTILWISANVLNVGLPPYLILAVHAPTWIVGCSLPSTPAWLWCCNCRSRGSWHPGEGRAAWAQEAWCGVCPSYSSRLPCSCHRRWSPSICVGA